MFTGLIEDIGLLVSQERGAGVCVLCFGPTRIDPASLELGESVAVNGVCLSVVRRDGQRFCVDASAETLERSTLGKLRPRDRVHLERALRVGDRLGGHLVQGHVDGVGQVAWVRRQQSALEMAVRCPVGLARCLVSKGSVAVDGVSLTVNRVEGDLFTVVLIPHTARETLLAERGVGDLVNLETDILGKYVLAALEQGMVPGAGRAREQPKSAAPGSEEGLLAALGRAGFIGPDNPAGNAAQVGSEDP